MENQKKELFLFISTLLLLTSVFTGCIRFKAGAGYTYQEKDDETPKTKSVGFDTQDIVDPDRPKGNITV